MPVVDVPCPNCRARLKAPDSIFGKKAQCKRCGKKFRVPVPAPASDVTANGGVLTVVALPTPAPPGESDEVLLTEAAPDEPPAKNLSHLPSADPFDFDAGGAAKPARPAPDQPHLEPLPLDDEPVRPAATLPRRDDADDRLNRSRPSRDEVPAKPRRSDDADDRPRKKRPRDADAEPAGAKRRPDDADDRPRKERRRDADAERDRRPRRADKAEPPPAADNPFAFDAPAPAADNPFAFPAAGGRPSERHRDDDEVVDKPRYRRSRGGSNKALLVTGLIGVLALLLSVAAFVASRKNRAPAPEPAKNEKKERAPEVDTPATPVPPDQPKGDPKKDAEAPKKNPDPKKGDPKKGDPRGPKDAVPPPPPAGRAYVSFGKLKSFTVGTPPAKPELSDPRKNEPLVLDVPPGDVRRVFPPADLKVGDTLVLVQAAAAADGKSQRLALETYGPAGNRVPAARIEYDGDGAAVPIADAHTSAAGSRFLAAAGGKLTVWELSDNNKKVADGVNPYADKPEHAMAGLAAAFFAPDPNLVIAVSTAGGVLLYDLTEKKVVDEFFPLNGTANKVTLGQSVAKADDNGSVLVAVAGVLSQVEAKDGRLQEVRKHDLGGDVVRSLGVAASGTPGRLLYAFETTTPAGKKETVVLGLPPGDDAEAIHYRFPAGAGEPRAALWTNGDAGGVVTDGGVVWFRDGDQGKFRPLVYTQAGADARYFGGPQFVWYVIPHPTAATKSLVVTVTGDFEARTEYQKSFPNQPLRAVRLDAKGLSK